MDVSLRDVAPLSHYDLVDGNVHLSIWIVDSWSGEPCNAAPDEHDVIDWFTPREAMALHLAHPDYPALLTSLAAGLLPPA